MAEIFATTSGKGGVGKSSIAAGLGFAFSQLGQNVLLVDMDEGLGCLDLILGIDDSAVLDLCDALDFEDITDAVYKSKAENLSLITAPKGERKIDSEKFVRFTDKANSLFDVIIFDFPAGLDFELYSLLPKNTVFLCVTTPDPVSVRDASAVSRELFKRGLSSRLIINRFDLKKHKKRRLKGIDGIIDSASIRLLGIVPESEDINLLSVKHKLRKKDRSVSAFLRIAERLRYKNVPLKKLKKI